MNRARGFISPHDDGVRVEMEGRTRIVTHGMIYRPANDIRGTGRKKKKRGKKKKRKKKERGEKKGRRN